MFTYSQVVPFIILILSVVIAIVIASLMGVFSWFKDPREKLQPDGKTVLITGGSQGLGLAVAKLLAAKGANIVIVARSIPKLELALAKIKAKAKSPSTQRFEYFSVDVTSYEANQKLIQDVTEWNDGQPPDVVWACAGMSKPGLFVDTDPKVLQAQMEVNYWSAANLLHSTLKLWLKPVMDKRLESIDPAKKGMYPISLNSRHFIFTASTVAYWGVAGYAPYSPGKAALRSLCDSIRQELFLYEGAAWAQSIKGFRPTRLHLVTPGNILSPGYDSENAHKHPVTKYLEKDDVAQKAKIVALDAVTRLEQGDYLVTTNLLGELMKSTALGGSKRNGLGIFDCVLGFIASLATLYIGPDMERTTYWWGGEKGIGEQGPAKEPNPILT